MKKNVIKTAFAVVCVVAASMGILASCSTSSEITGMVEDLSGQTVVIQNPDQALYPLFHVGDIVLSVDRNDQSYYGSVYKNKELGKPELLFRYGNGHNEFSKIKFGKKTNNALLLINGTLSPRSLTIVPLTDSLKNISDPSTWKRYSFADNPSLIHTSYNYCSVSDSTLMMIGHSPESQHNIMSIFDYKNNKVHPLSFWPEDGVDASDFVKQRIYTEYSKLYDNGKNRYLYTSGIARYAFIFTLDGSKVNVEKTIYSTYPKYVTREDGLNYRLKGMGVDAYSFAVNDKYIYCLLRDYNIKGEILGPKKSGGYGNVVEVFDWNGKKVKTINLDHLGKEIMLSDDGKKLFLFSVDSSGDEVKRDMWEYDLKK